MSIYPSLSANHDCAVEATACSNSTACASVVAAWNVDFAAKVAAFSDTEVYEEFGAAMDAAADDSDDVGVQYDNFTPCQLVGE